MMYFSLVEFKFDILLNNFHFSTIFVEVVVFSQVFQTQGNHAIIDQTFGLKFFMQMLNLTDLNCLTVCNRHFAVNVYWPSGFSSIIIILKQLRVSVGPGSRTRCRFTHTVINTTCKYARNKG